MIVHELERLALSRVISHWELGTEDRGAPDGVVTIYVYRVFLSPWIDLVAEELTDRFRAIQCAVSPHRAVIVNGGAPHISVPLG
jgi:hypothetical protein